MFRLYTLSRYLTNKNNFPWSMPECLFTYLVSPSLFSNQKLYVYFRKKSMQFKIHDPYHRAGRCMIPTTGQWDPWSLPQGREPSSRRWQDQVSAIPRYLVEIKVTTPQRSIISCHFSCHVRPWQPQDIVLLIDRLTGLQLCMVLETAWRGLLVERTWRELHSVVWPLTH